MYNMAGKAHHNTAWYKRTAPLIRQAARNNPHHRCPICNMTLAEMRQARPGSVVGWDAGHLVAGNDSYGLQAECSFCNRSRGSRSWHDRKKTTSRRWGT